MSTQDNNDYTIKNTENQSAADKYKIILNSIDEGYCIIKMIYDNGGKAIDWRYLEVNPAFEINNGLSNAVGKTILEMTPDIEPKWFEIYDRVAQTGEPIRFREDSVALKRVFNLYAFKIGNPEERNVAVIFTDITKQAQAEETELKFRTKLQEEVEQRTAELNKSKELLQATLDSSLDMIQVFKAVRNSQGKIIDFAWILNNNVSAEIYGDVINQSLLKNNPGVVATGIFDHFAKVTETGIPQQYEKHYVYEQFDGWFHQSVVKLDDGVATSTTDITNRKLAEQEINQLNKMLILKNRELEAINSELSTFNNIAANDYNETFRALYLNLEHLIKSDAAQLSNSGRANLRKAQGTIQKMKMLTEDIVAFSKLPFIDSVTASVNLNDILINALDNLKDKTEQCNASVRAENLPVIKGYPLLVSLLFDHILDNAVKFRKKDTEPSIEIKSALIKKAVPENIHEQEFYEIQFTDNGIGIDPAETGNIFAIFYRLHERNVYRGSGIGLAVCRKIMSLHNGYITATSKPGTGTVITCLFPVT